MCAHPHPVPQERLQSPLSLAQGGAIQGSMKVKHPPKERLQVAVARGPSTHQRAGARSSSSREGNPRALMNGWTGRKPLLEVSHPEQRRMHFTMALTMWKTQPQALPSLPPSQRLPFEVVGAMPTIRGASPATFSNEDERQAPKTALISNAGQKTQTENVFNNLLSSIRSPLFLIARKKLMFSIPWEECRN